eukprot:CAMPEP_0115049364 /NCGR_PEP_ID=MMETSP0227-20121206/1145_1 /TAXON_ID=89957 /ORGANISM="Polarella glacialis, Strain CCMP 1383" /LENGTH=170 /DNA_ID=CAMNT_0002433015 /DNA_START=358 /DNA_END=870 /DNA_ORIENTATION=+
MEHAQELRAGHLLLGAGCSSGAEIEALSRGIFSNTWITQGFGWRVCQFILRSFVRVFSDGIHRFKSSLSDFDHEGRLHPVPCGTWFSTVQGQLHRAPVTSAPELVLGTADGRHVEKNLHDDRHDRGPKLESHALQTVEPSVVESKPRLLSICAASLLSQHALAIILSSFL